MSGSCCIQSKDIFSFGRSPAPRPFPPSISNSRRIISPAPAEGSYTSSSDKIVRITKLSPARRGRRLSFRTENAMRAGSRPLNKPISPSKLSASTTNSPSGVSTLKSSMCLLSSVKSYRSIVS